MVVALGCKDRAEERVIVLVVGAGQDAHEMGLRVIGLADLESEAVARGSVLDREDRVPGKDEANWVVHTQSAEFRRKRRAARPA